MIDQIHLAFRDENDPADLASLHDNICEAIADPVERRVQFEALTEIWMAHQPETMKDIVNLLDASTFQAKRELLDRARAKHGLPGVFEEKASHNRAPTPERDAAGRVAAVCHEPGCRQYLPGEHGQQVALVDVIEYYCPDHADAHPEAMEKWEPPRYEIGPSGAIVDVAERERDIRKAKADDERLRLEREVREAEAAQDAAALAEFEAARRERALKEAALQFPHGFPTGDAA